MPEENTYLESFVKGINAYLAEQTGERPVELRIFGYDPDPFAPSDNISIDTFRSVSRKIFEEIPHVKKQYCGKPFWARGSFCVTSLRTDKKNEYLEHHFEKGSDDKFDIE